MSQYQEGCQLRLDEIAAVLSLAGKRSLVGFQTEEIQSLTPEKIWSACCRLVRDRMMTQIDGKFRLCPELVNVMQPVCMAEQILVLTPASDLVPQAIYYCSDRVASMECTPYGRYILAAMEPEELTGDVTERMDLSFEEESGAREAALEIDVQCTDSREKLLAGALFVVECLDGGTGERRGWLRLVVRGMDRWLQWTEKGTVCCEELTQALLEKHLQMLRRGEDI